MGAVKVCSKDECQPGTMKAYEVNGKTILLANVNGQFYGCENVCTHRGGPLAEGQLEGTAVTCPWHGAQFDVTSGKVLALPAGADLKSYKIAVKGNDLFVEF